MCTIGLTSVGIFASYKITRLPERGGEDLSSICGGQNKCTYFPPQIIICTPWNAALGHIHLLICFRNLEQLLEPLLSRSQNL